MAAERSLRRQVALTLSAAILGVMALAMLTALMFLHRVVEERVDGRLLAAAAVLQNAVARAPGGGITLDAEPPTDPVFANPTSGWGWVVREGERILARSRSLAVRVEGVSLPVAAADGAGPGRAADGTWRSVTLAVRGEEGLTVTAAAQHGVVRSDVTADAALVLPAIALLALLLVAVAWTQTRRALRPVEDLARALARLKAGAIETLPPTRFQELDALSGLINDLAAERRKAGHEARDRAARLAHGLKTPLAMLSARFGARGARPDPKVVEAVARMNRLIRLHLAEARTGHASAIRPEPVAIRPMVEDLAAAFRHTLGRGNLVFANDLPATFRLPIPGDDAQELLGNLLENAFRHAAYRVRIAAPDAGTLRIENDGDLFPEAILAAATADGDGAEVATAGLGLRIARHILHRHGGALALANEDGQRAVALVRMPPAETGLQAATDRSPLPAP